MRGRRRPRAPSDFEAIAGVGSRLLAMLTASRPSPHASSASAVQPWLSFIDTLCSRKISAAPPAAAAPAAAVSDTARQAKAIAPTTHTGNWPVAIARSTAISASARDAEGEMAGGAAAAARRVSTMSSVACARATSTGRNEIYHRRSPSSTAMSRVAPDGRASTRSIVSCP